MSASAVPPSDWQRLVMFCSLVDDYDDLAEALPVDQHGFSVGSGPRPPVDRWSRSLRAMVLRKFVLTRRDQMHLDRVLDSFAAVTDDTGVHAAIDRLREQVLELPFSKWISYVADDGSEMTAQQLIGDVVYGGLLHGDYGRWAGLRDTGRVTVDQATWQFTLGAEALVRALRHEIRSATTEGPLRSVCPPRRSE